MSTTITTRDCRSCALPTEHRTFHTTSAVAGVITRTEGWYCTQCLTHWAPPKKNAVLYTCSCCGTRSLLFTQRGETVAKPVADCFKPDPKLVDQVEFLCSRCIPADIAEGV